MNNRRLLVALRYAICLLVLFCWSASSADDGWKNRRVLCGRRRIPWHDGQCRPTAWVVAQMSDNVYRSDHDECHVARKEPGREFGIACDDFWLLWMPCDYYDKQHGSHEEKIEKLKKKFPSI